MTNRPPSGAEKSTAPGFAFIVLGLAFFLLANGQASAAPFHPEDDRGQSRQGPQTKEKNHSGLKKGVFLVAERKLKDPNFEKTVVLLTHYGPTGTVGVIINRPTETSLSEALPEIKEFENSRERLFFGGPVLRKGMVLLIRSAEDVAESYHVFGNVYFSGSVKALTKALSDEDSSARVYAGYTGWAPGQLEFEINRGDWRVIDADEMSIFERDPATLWDSLMRPEDQLWIKIIGAPAAWRL
ncbi:MAG: YqgE/AlgH family protein [Candidatus Nitrospinota bacterium M3_3B_026]